MRWKTIAVLLFLCAAAGLEAQQTIYWKKDYLSDGASVIAVATPAPDDTDAPTTPSNLSVTAVEPFKASFSWSASTDTSPGVVAGYHLFRGPSIVGTIPAGTTTFTDPTLTPATAYTYKVAAFDVDGNQSALSSAVSFITGPLIAASSTSSSQVDMTWHEISGADHYVVSRRTTGSYSVIGTPSTASFSDTSVSASTTYVYKVVARNSSNDEISSYSYPDIATTVSFTDPDLEAGVTVMKAVHITELRNAVDLARTAAGLGGASWSGSLTSGSTVISAAHIAELRTNLNAALAALGASLWTYTDPTLTAAATRIKRVHINELRERVK